jgi:hypothetical protein
MNDMPEPPISAHSSAIPINRRKNHPPKLRWILLSFAPACVAKMPKPTITRMRKSVPADIAVISFARKRGPATMWAAKTSVLAMRASGVSYQARATSEQ